MIPAGGYQCNACSTAFSLYLSLSSDQTATVHCPICATSAAICKAEIQTEEGLELKEKIADAMASLDEAYGYLEQI